MGRSCNFTTCHHFLLCTASVACALFHFVLMEKVTYYNTMKVWCTGTEGSWMYSSASPLVFAKASWYCNPVHKPVSICPSPTSHRCYFTWGPCFHFNFNSDRLSNTSWRYLSFPFIVHSPICTLCSARFWAVTSRLCSRNVQPGSCSKLLF